MPFHPGMVDCVHTILVITKHKFMGDTVVATPLLRAVRRAFPRASITLLTGGGAAVLLKEFPYVDHIETYDPRKNQRSLMSKVRLGQYLSRDGRPDLCLLTDRSFRSAMIAFFTRARLRVGFNTELRGWLLTDRVPYDKDAWETECFLDVLRAVAPEREGEPCYDPTPILCVTEEERARGAQILREREAIGPRLVGIQPGATYLRKQWDTARFAEVARSLAADGAGIVLIGGPEEEPVARAMREAVCAQRPGMPVVDLTGATSLRETMGVLTNLSLFIGNDTGVSHIAASLGVPTLSLFGPTRAGKWGERGPQNVVISAPGGDLSRLGTAPVLAAARSLLTGSPAPLSPASAPAAPIAARRQGALSEEDEHASGGDTSLVGAKRG